MKDTEHACFHAFSTSSGLRTKVAGAASCGPAWIRPCGSAGSGGSDPVPAPKGHRQGGQALQEMALFISVEVRRYEP